MGFQKIYNIDNNKTEIKKTWLTRQSSCTLVIPRRFAIEYGLDTPSHIILEKTDDGILIKKFDLEQNHLKKGNAKKKIDSRDAMFCGRTSRESKKEK